MKRDAHHAKSWWSRLGRAAFAALVVGVGSGAAGCLSRPINPLEPRTTTVEVEKLTETAVDKIDLLLMIDNSASMADKQQVLADAVPQLVSGLLNPKCVDDNGNPIASQPASPTDMCPTGSKRDFNPVYDVHVGIVTSSLGSHGTGQTGVCDPSQGGNQNDAGHLIHRVMGDPVG
ncbi:MAG TPA: hypothetical protein VHB21_05105, partial [Minicystis sp.]|nr:hypothetical protein [Minicystis sp.]